MTTLSPAPDTLGLASPALGPWFRDGSASSPTLGLPTADLSVALSLPINMEWRAPASGLASWIFAAEPRPPLLASLRSGEGSAAFTTGNLVVLLSLLPEVEVRLAGLSADLPSPDGINAAVGQPGRPVVRHFALEIPSASADRVSRLQNLRGSDFAADLDSDEKRAAFLGLVSGSTGLANGGKSARELHRPNRSNAVIVKNRSGSALGCALWAFDDHGRALDPGAVAAWWAYLADSLFDNLWAHDDTADKRTATTAAGRSVLFCTAHQAALPREQQLRLALSDLTQVGSSGALYTVGASPAVALTPAPASGHDELPLPRLAALPNGAYAAPSRAQPFAGWTRATWPSMLSRDFMRIALLDLERHLVGVGRDDAAQGNNRQRIAVLRNTAVEPILSTADQAHDALIDTLLEASSPAQLMAPVLDRDWGPLAVPVLGNGTPPTALSFSVHALRDQGTEVGNTVTNQRIVVRVTNLPANAWLRIWPKGLDTTSGQHFRLDGGAGRADGGGIAYAVMLLPDGTAALKGMSFDAMVVTGTEAKLYVEQRFDRPPTEASTGALQGNTAWICEQGVALMADSHQLGSGQTLLAVPPDPVTGAYALIDSTAASDAATTVLRNAAVSGDRLIVTTPAFNKTPEGSVLGAGGGLAASVLHRARNGLTDDSAHFGWPAPSMERREVAAVNAAAAVGAIGAAPGRAWLHEMLPSQLGHPGAPAAAEVHATGVALAGPATAALDALMRERAAENLADFLRLASQPAATAADTGDTSSFVAVLETVTHGVAGDGRLRTYVDNPSSYAPGKNWDALKADLEPLAPSIDLESMLPGNADRIALAAALDRVILKTRDGAAQAARALNAAIGRAEDFIYIETPALDALEAGLDGDKIDLLGAMIARLAERPALAILLCVPERFLPDQPPKLEAIRSAGLRGALNKLLRAAPDNVVLFTPTAGPGRPLHMASTTVIVDDVWLLSGSTHLWRRGLSFDSSLAVALFDEATARGRSAGVRAARRQLLADRLGIGLALVSDDMDQMLKSIRRLNAAGGLSRVKPDAYPAENDQTTATDQQLWNPDGRPGVVNDWFSFFGKTEAAALRDAIR